jgi:hypothetical protein
MNSNKYVVQFSCLILTGLFNIFLNSILIFSGFFMGLLTSTVKHKIMKSQLPQYTAHPALQDAQISTMPQSTIYAPETLKSWVNDSIIKIWKPGIIFPPLAHQKEREEMRKSEMQMNARTAITS